MKKGIIGILAFISVFVLVACNNTNNNGDNVNELLLEAEGYHHYVTGNFAGWEEAFGDEEYQMEPTVLSDSRVEPIREDLIDMQYLYILEVTFPDEDPDWGGTYTIEGTDTEWHGNQTVKFGKTTTEEPDIPLFWIPSPESGKLFNLTPETLFIPNYIDENSEDYDPDAGTGHWNDNPIVLETGTYYIVYAFVDGNHYAGAIPVE